MGNICKQKQRNYAEITSNFPFEHTICPPSQQCKLEKFNQILLDQKDSFEDVFFQKQYDIEEADISNENREQEYFSSNHDQKRQSNQIETLPNDLSIPQINKLISNQTFMSYQRSTVRQIRNMMNSQTINYLNHNQKESNSDSRKSILKTYSSSRKTRQASNPQTVRFSNKEQVNLSNSKTVKKHKKKYKNQSKCQ